MSRFVMLISLVMMSPVCFSQPGDTVNHRPNRDGQLDKLDMGKSDAVPPAFADSSQVFAIVDKMPSFPGGETAMLEFLKRNLKFPEDAKENGIDGKIFLSFIIETDGRITNVKVDRGITGGGLNQEAIRVVKSMPDWIPGTNKGRVVRVSYKLPITFKLQ